MRLFGLITLSLTAMALIAITSVLWQNMKEPVVAKANDGMSEGIKVHGDWEVKVTDPETGVEELYAFSNALQENLGSNVLALAILGEAEISPWEGIASYNPDTWNVAALIYEGEDIVGNCKSDYITPVLATNEGLISGGVAAKLRLSGSCEASVSGEIGRVSSMHSAPPEMITSGFTAHILDETIPVQKGQLLSFNVLISFE